MTSLSTSRTATRSIWATMTRSVWLGRLICIAVLASFAVTAWTATERGSWTGSMLFNVAVYVGFEGFAVPAWHPWWFRRLLEALALPIAASAVRWPDLAPDGGIGWTVLGAAGLAVIIAILIRDRRHCWGVSSAQPLARFPLSGTWYVIQGGGRSINHHYGVAAQRGAIDVVRTGRLGTRSGSGRSLQSYLAYGEDVVAPCDGVVETAVDAVEDQIPGTIRYAPLAGNHIVINTGSETVLLAHLRPGTVAVTAGDRVRGGQFLAQVGNSGNTTEPHLHLHVERDGLGLDLRFSTIHGRLYRGRSIRG